MSTGIVVAALAITLLGAAICAAMQHKVEHDAYRVAIAAWRTHIGMPRGAVRSHPNLQVRRGVGTAMSDRNALANRIFIQAISESRAQDLLDCLLHGGSCTVDAITGQLVLISAEQVEGLK